MKTEKDVIEILKKNNLPYDSKVVSVQGGTGGAWMEINLKTFIEVHVREDGTLKYLNSECLPIGAIEEIPEEQGRLEWLELFDELCTKPKNLKKLINKI